MAKARVGGSRPSSSAIVRVVIHTQAQQMSYRERVPTGRGKRECVGV